MEAQNDDLFMEMQGNLPPKDHNLQDDLISPNEQVPENPINMDNWAHNIGEDRQSRLMQYEDNDMLKNE